MPGSPRTRPGYLARTDAVWAMRFSDHELLRNGASKKRWACTRTATRPTGSSPEWTDRGPNFALHVDEICAATDRRVRLAVAVRAGFRPDPRGHLRQGLGGRSAARPAARPAQRHRRPTRTTSGCASSTSTGRSGCAPTAPGARGGRGDRLDSVPGTRAPGSSTWTATAERSPAPTPPPQVRLDIRDLGACFVGGTPLARLVTADRVTGEPAAAAGTRCRAGHPARTLVPGGLLILAGATGNADRRPARPPRSSTGPDRSGMLNLMAGSWQDPTAPHRRRRRAARRAAGPPAQASTAPMPTRGRRPDHRPTRRVRHGRRRRRPRT